MVIPVVWLTFEPDTLARGHWHDEMLGDLFDRRVWRPVDALEYQHYVNQPGDTFVVSDPTPAVAPLGWRLGLSGAAVIISGAENADHVAALNHAISDLDWCLLIVAGDEMHLFPRDEIEHPRCEVWAQCTRPGDTQRALGFGYPPGTRAGLARMKNYYRDVPWSFVGQVTNQRRVDMLAATRDVPEGAFVGTDRFAAHLDGHGLARDDYMALLTRSRVALCPAGPHTVDSFRLFEALEAGCIPLADAKTPTFDDPGYWSRVFGGQPPFPMLGEWESLPGWLAELLLDATARANTISAFYQAWKRSLAYELDETVRRLQGHPAVLDATLADLISVVVTTSPAPLHPSTEHIEATIDSIRAQLPDSEIIIVADGVRPEQEDQRDAYDEYLARLTWLCNLRWHNVLPVVLPEWGHQANATCTGLDYVRTPLFLFAEHDTPLCGEIDWESCARAIRSGAVNVIRFAHEAQVLDVHRYLMLDDEPIDVEGAPLLRTVQWSGRPHLAPTLWYRAMLDRYFAPESRTYVEDVLYGVVEDAWNAHGMAGWEQWRLALYAPPLPLKRSEHLDSRGDAEKYAMTFAYPGEPPAGAPLP